MKSRQIVVADTFYVAVMPHNEICMRHMGIAGKVMKFRLDLNDQVFLYDEQRDQNPIGPITPSEAGLFQEGGEWYFYPIQSLEDENPQTLPLTLNETEAAFLLVLLCEQDTINERMREMDYPIEQINLEALAERVRRLNWNFHWNKQETDDGSQEAKTRA